MSNSNKLKTWSHELGCWVKKGTKKPLSIEEVCSVKKRKYWLSLSREEQTSVLANKYFWIISRPQTKQSVSKNGNKSQAVVKGSINKKLHYFSYLLKEMSSEGATKDEVEELWRGLNDNLNKVMGTKYVKLGERPPQVTRSGIGRSNKLESLEKQFDLWSKGELFVSSGKKK